MFPPAALIAFLKQNLLQRYAWFKFAFNAWGKAITAKPQGFWRIAVNFQWCDTGTAVAVHQSLERSWAKTGMLARSGISLGHMLDDQVQTQLNSAFCLKNPKTLSRNDPGYQH